MQRPLVPLLAMLLLVLSLVAGISIIYYLFYSILGLLAITFFWTRSLAQNITVQRRLRTKWAVVGDLIEEDFVIANEGRLPALWVEVRDDSTIPDFNPGVVESIGPGEERQFHARTVCRRRGLYTLGPVRILTGDPFGIFRGSIVYYQVNSFIVYPPIMEGPGIPLPYGTVGGSSRLQPQDAPRDNRRRRYPRFCARRRIEPYSLALYCSAGAVASQGVRSGAFREPVGHSRHGRCGPRRRGR